MLYKMKNLFKKIKVSSVEKSIFAGLIFSILISIVSFSNTCEKISDKVMRIHILANSNSHSDQDLKLKVRDKILEHCNSQNLENFDENFIFLKKNIKIIEEISKNEISKNGSSYDVNAKLEKMLFNTRYYENFTMPAGHYKALRVIIGEGRGENFFCVYYPPMCVPAARKTYCPEENFAPCELNLLENGDKYEIKFKTVELFESVRERVFNWFVRVFSFFSFKKESW
ncbi:MAG: stage II sporulation protein R [Oscillospiraceae bacterium]|nr:stage II sporulation protein R [Oscillospiraceae bacterium]